MVLFSKMATSPTIQSVVDYVSISSRKNPKTYASYGLTSLIALYGLYRLRSEATQAKKEERRKEEEDLARRIRMGAQVDTSSTTKSGKKKKRGRITSKFLHQLKLILTTCCGKREAFNAGVLTLTLLARTILSVWMANHLGITVNAFCEQRWGSLLRLIIKFGFVTVGGAFLNAALKYYAANLRLCIRQRLTSYVHGIYMKPGDMTYYKANKVGIDKLENADQLITDDIEKFSATVADVFSQALKPTVDFFVFSVQLARVQGLVGPFGMYLWFFIATVVTTKILPPYGKLAANKQKLEGRFRARHAELITNCEQIAFMGGERPERAVLDEAYERIHQHELSAMRQKLFANVVTGYMNKYFASVVGLFLISQPVYFNRNGMAALTPGDIAKYYVSISRVMAGLSDAVQLIFDLSNRIGELAGLTGRVSTLFKGLTDRLPVLEAEIKSFQDTNPASKTLGETLNFENVSVFRPDGVLLVKDLNFSVAPGSRVIVTGPNGCGKSSLFRVLRGLWPLVCGKVTKPADHEIYFLSQVNFVPVGTLRDVVIYPDTPEEMKNKGRDDTDLRTVLRWADLENLQFDGVKPELDDERDWGVDLSPGQKQRIAFARLLYHRPRYAVLDECTNGISPDVEQALYDRCRQLGMAVFSISHKLELKKQHDYELNYVADAAGSYSFEPIVHDGSD